MCRSKTLRWLLMTVCTAFCWTSVAVAAESKPLKAGYGRAKINPFVGVKMMGWAGRDQRGCLGIRDDCFVRALYLEQGDEKMLIMGMDLCLLSRQHADRYKTAIGREFDIYSRQILMNVSHNHVAPSSGTWFDGHYETPDWDYLNVVEEGVVAAARQARDAARPATMWVGKGSTKIPVCRRKPKEDGSGTVEWGQYFEGITYDQLPVCLLKDAASGDPLCLLFSISTHASFKSGNEVSAEWPGAAVKQLDKFFGGKVGLFLQGVGGDSKAYLDGWTGDFDKMDQLGRLAADDTIRAMSRGLKQVQPQLRSSIVMTHWPLQPVEKASLENAFKAAELRLKESPLIAGTRYKWAKQQLKLIQRGRLPSTWPIQLHGIKLAENVRMVGMEGEAVAEWGFFIEEFYGKDNGLTIPMGYSNGQGAYLPVSRQLPELGYEVESYPEYDLPSPFAPGMEAAVLAGLRQLKQQGID